MYFKINYEDDTFYLFEAVVNIYFEPSSPSEVAKGLKRGWLRLMFDDNTWRYVSLQGMVSIKLFDKKVGVE